MAVYHKLSNNVDADFGSYFIQKSLKLRICFVQLMLLLLIQMNHKEPMSSTLEIAFAFIWLFDNAGDNTKW